MEATEFRLSEGYRQKVACLLKLDDPDDVEGNYLATIQEIEGWIWHYKQATAAKRIPGGKERDLVRRVRRASASLRGAIERVDTTFIQDFGDFLKFNKQLERLESISARAGELPAVGGRPKNEIANWLICQLAGLFQCRRGRKAAVSYSDADGRYKGDFYDLVEIAVANTPSEKRRVVNVTLGQSIKRALTEVQKSKKL